MRRRLNLRGLPGLARRNARGLAFLAGLASLCRGLFLAWEPLGWIVPGALVCAALAWTHLRGGGR